MTYQALYRVWRPQTFTDVSGQEMITQTLKNAIRQKKSSHAYLFSGPRGTGKTSVAKIFAKAINCPNSVDGEPCNNCTICEQITNGSLGDVIEIDAASNNGVEEIRDIRDKANYAPTQAEYKVYIIDEVHMLSMGAFNALLKTLEEPPRNVVFVLATTEPHKIPLTIISRTQRFDFRRISQEDIISRMEYILDEKGIEHEEDALLLIAKAAEGGMRDALSILDQALSFHEDHIQTDDIQRITGSVTQDLLEHYLDSLAGRDTKEALNLLQSLLSEGKDAGRFVEDVILFARDLLLFQNTQAQERSIYKIAKFSETFENLAMKLPEDFLYEVIRVFNDTQQELRLSNHAEVYLEVATIKLSQHQGGAASKPIEQPSQVVEPVANVSDISTEEVQKLQSELQTLKAAITSIQENGTGARPKKAPTKTREGNFQADRTAVYQVLAEATHQDLRDIKSVWVDLLDILDVGQKALLNNSEPVAASPTSLVVKFEYGILCERAQEDADLQDKVNNYLDKIIQKRIQLVPVTSKEWPELRQDYINQMNNPSQQSAEDDEQSQTAPKPTEEDEVVSKAVEFFGENIVEVIE